MIARLARCLRELGKPRILVLGDLLLDRYVWGRMERISPEAPVPILKVESDRDLRPGGAANVSLNLQALGARVACLGTVGEDAAGRTLARLLDRAGVGIAGLVVDRAKPTPVKTRMIAHRQQILRIDEEESAPVSPAIATKLLRAFRREARKADLVLVSDYGKGALTDPLLAAVVAEGRKRGLPVLIDPKGRDYAKYRGATALTPNQAEAELASGVEIRSPESLREAARRLVDGLALDFVVVTRGEQGMSLFAPPTEGAEAELHVPAQAREVYDVTGAGDTAIAMLGLALAAGASREESLHLANRAAGLVVGKLGTATVTRKEVLDALAAEHRGHAAKIHPPAALGRILARHRRAGERVAFTNGCFDLLHAGHVQSLRFARAQADLLVVGINSDASVRRLKGEARPILSQAERAQVLAALEDVDYVTIYAEDTPHRVLELLRPDILVKGGDCAWRKEGVVGREVVEGYGGRVELAPYAQGLSTTNIVDRILERCGRAAAKDEAPGGATGGPS
ncbi:MAG: D-glycero-beta-D-manno-heptose-7-phosphate kinase [Planctomycetes bacterium]|nr:D-glycero-beta-D-manno-heptose-7-phosphate kinase [Planctomycetota bacterium]